MQGETASLLAWGIVPILIHGLESPAASCGGHVAADSSSAVANLSASSGECKLALVEAGVCEALMGVVEGGTPHAVAQACRALGNLTYGWGPEVI